MENLIKVYLVRGTPRKIKTAESLLKANGFEVSRTRLSDYLIVYERDPSAVAKKLGLGVFDITGQDYIDIMEETACLNSILSPAKEGDLVEITEGEFKGTCGIVEKMSPPTALVILTLWGSPLKVELPVKFLRKKI